MVSEQLQGVGLQVIKTVQREQDVQSGQDESSLSTLSYNQASKIDYLEKYVAFQKEKFNDIYKKIELAVSSEMLFREMTYLYSY